MLRKTGVDRLRDGQTDAQSADETVTDSQWIDGQSIVEMATDSRGTDRQPVVETAIDSRRENKRGQADGQTDGLSGDRRVAGGRNGEGQSMEK